MGGTLGRCGSSSVENIVDFFFHDANLSKTACYKKPKLSSNWGGPTEENFLRLTAKVVAIFLLRLTQTNTK